MRTKITAEQLKEIGGKITIACLESTCQTMLYAMLHYINSLDAQRRALQNYQERNAEDEVIKGRLHDLARYEVQSLFYRLLWLYDERYGLPGRDQH